MKKEKHSLNSDPSSNQNHVANPRDIYPSRRPNKTPPDANTQLRPQDLRLRFPQPCAGWVRRGILHREFEVRSAAGRIHRGKTRFLVCDRENGLRLGVFGGSSWLQGG